MEIDRVLRQVEIFFKNTLKKNGEVIGAVKTDDGWRAQIEVLEDEDYMRKHARHGLIALYDVRLTNDLEVIHYERKSLRERGKFDAVPQ